MVSFLLKFHGLNAQLMCLKYLKILITRFNITNSNFAILLRCCFQSFIRASIWDLSCEHNLARDALGALTAGTVKLGTYLEQRPTTK